MKTCPSEETLSAYCDGVLDALDQAEVAAHLQECRVCRRLESDFRALSINIFQLPDLEVPGDFRKNLLTRLQDEPQKAARRGWLTMPWVRVAAAAVVVVALGLPAYGWLSANYRQGAKQDLQMTAGKAASQAQPQRAAESAAIKSMPPVADSAQAKSMTVEPSSPQAHGNGGMNNSREIKIIVDDVLIAQQKLLQQVEEIPGARVSFLDKSPESLKISIEVPGQKAQDFLSGLKVIGRLAIPSSEAQSDTGEVQSFNLIISKN